MVVQEPLEPMNTTSLNIYFVQDTSLTFWYISGMHIVIIFVIHNTRNYMPSNPTCLYIYFQLHSNIKRQETDGNQQR